MFCLSSQSPSAEQLLRRRARLVGAIASGAAVVRRLYSEPPARSSNASTRRRAQNSQQTLTLDASDGEAPPGHFKAAMCPRVAAFAN